MEILRFYFGLADGNWMHVARKPAHFFSAEEAASTKKRCAKIDEKVLHIFAILHTHSN
jgi:hypothetical protein